MGIVILLGVLGSTWRWVNVKELVLVLFPVFHSETRMLDLFMNELLSHGDFEPS